MPRNFLATRRRSKVWADTLFNVVIPNAGSSATSLMSTLDPDERLDVTITRLIVCLYLYPETPNEVTSIQLADLGVGIASQDAFTAGATADPNDPGDFPQAGWMYRCRHVVINNSTAANRSPLIVIREDLRAMRKLQRGELYLKISNINTQGAAMGIRMIGTVRALLALP